MISKQQIPFVRILLYFIVGVIIADRFRSYNILVYIVPIIIIVSFISLVIKRWPINYRWIPGALLMIAVTGIGYSSYMTHSPEHQIGYVGVQSEKAYLYTVTIKEKPKHGKRLRCVSSVKNKTDLEYNTSYQNGQILLYIDTTDLKLSIEIGDELVINTKIYAVKNNTNPDVFDYKSYLYYRDVNLQSYISSDDIISHKKHEGFDLFLLTQQWRSTFQSIIQKYILQQEEQAIALAMLLGIKNNLSTSLYSSFTNSGAVHVLAVSGLHVGFVAMIFYLLLNLIPIRSKRITVIKSIIIIIGIFLYGLMTGMAPAIMRATIMYSIFIVARTWRPATNSFNLLAFSAFVMILYNPFMLFQAGFQFSYLAIWGIMAFHHPIRSLVYVKSNIGKYILDMITVSLAAQLLVFPITVYYFHKFPSYFFISGLLAIPAAAIIISLGIGLIIFSFILPIINEILLAPLLSATLNILITGIEWINRWPMSNIDGIYIDKTMMLILYSIIAFISLYRLSKRKLFVFSSLFGAVFLLIVILSHSQSVYKNNNFIIYDSYGHSCIDYFIQNKVYNIKSTDLQQKDYKFLTYNHRLKKAIKETIHINVDSTYKDNNIQYQDNYLQAGAKLFFIANGNIIPHFTTPLKIDYLIITNGNKQSIKTLLLSFQATQIIIDHSIDKKQIWKLKKEANNIPNSVHFIGRDGVFSELLE